MDRSTHYKSLVNGNTYSRQEYVNHGFGEAVIWKGKKDLPKNEYPFTLITIREEYKNPDIARLYPSPQLP